MSKSVGTDAPQSYSNNSRASKRSMSLMQKSVVKSSKAPVLGKADLWKNILEGAMSLRRYLHNDWNLD